MQVAYKPLVAFFLIVLVVITGAICTVFRYQVVVVDQGPMGVIRYDRWTGRADYLLPQCRDGKVVWPMLWGQPDDPDVAKDGCLSSNPFDQFDHPK